jgi:hypothetical protein
MRPPRPLPLWIAFLLLGLVGFVARSRAYAEDAPGKPSPGKEGGPAEPGLDEEGDIDDSEDGPAEFREAVDKAIDKGVDWLRKKQGGDGSWGAIEGNAKYGGGEGGGNKQQHSGPTSLALYTLLKCKVPENDPVVKKGFAWLRKNHRLPKDAYETSMLLLAITATADPFKKRTASEAAAEKDKVKLSGEMRGWANDVHKHLLKKRASLGWRYGTGSSTPGGDQDLSSTQMACLALFAADRCGIKTSGKIWNDMITFSMKMQEKDGPKVDRAVEAPSDEKPGKNPAPDTTPEGGGAAAAGEKPQDRARGHAYILSDDLDPDEGQATGGMTACGLGTIMMARFILRHQKDNKDWANRDQAAVQQSVYDSVAWLSHNFEPITNPKKKRINVYHLYYLYCVERAFDMIGNRRLGKRFWYVEMGQRLLQIQKPQGFWNTGTAHKPEDTLDTCFALLFLKRATRGGIPFPSITGGDEVPPVDNRGK